MSAAPSSHLDRAAASFPADLVAPLPPAFAQAALLAFADRLAHALRAELRAELAGRQAARHGAGCSLCRGDGCQLESCRGGPG